MTKASKAVARIPRSRAPNGIDSAHRLRISLLPAERAEIERRAFVENRSISSLARIYLLRGMESGTGAEPQAEEATGIDSAA